MPHLTAVGTSVRCPSCISYGGTKGTPKKNDLESRNSCSDNFKRGSHGVTLWMRRAKESKRALKRSASMSLMTSGRSELATAEMPIFFNFNFAAIGVRTKLERKKLES